tara:strand:+ start:411 stop:698 length:288 start_codon:yes stop_codon:yes gene_type:complete
MENWIIWGSIIIGYGVLWFGTWLADSGKRKEQQRREIERRRIQDREWAEQEPAVRLLVAALRARRREEAEILDELRRHIGVKKPKEKVNWKKDGF